MTPGNAYYLDMAYCDDWDSTGGHWAGTVPLEKPFAFECLIPRFDGAILSEEWKEALWDKFVMAAPRTRTP